MDPALPSQPPPRLTPYITAIELFKNLDPAILDDLESSLQWVTLAAGEVLFKQGCPGDSLCILVHGRLQITKKEPDGREIELDDLRPGVIVGEIALLTGQRHAASAVAGERSALVRLSRDTFFSLAAQQPQLLTNVARTVLPRIHRLRLATILTNLFGNLDVNTLHAVQASMTWQHLANGDLLFRQGDPGDALYFVVSGRLKVVRELPDGREKTVTEIGSGEMVGEFALITAEPRAATLYAMRETNVVKLPKHVFEQLVQQYPAAMMNISRTIVKRQLEQQATPTPRESHKLRATTIAVIPLNQNVPHSEFTTRLQAALSGLGSTLHLNGSRLDARYGQPGAAHIPAEHPTHSVLTYWLSQQETEFRYILYEADHDWSTWTERCLNQADKILLVTTGDSTPEMTSLESKIRQVAVQSRFELVLLHLQPNTQPANTRRWLKERSVSAHHHLRWTTDQHFQRLARRLADRHIGLVLSGGGARGFIHVGIIRALAEMDVPVDVVGGTSMGALVASSLAAEKSPDKIYELFRAIASRKRVLDYTLPLVSVMTTRKITTLIRELAGDAQIEDLWRPFFCVSANISRSEPHIHQQGPLWEALRAGMAAIPVFAPSLFNGDVHVDGSYMNNFPLDVMQERFKCNLLIGGNATSLGRIIKKYQFEPSISGWQVLWSKLNPFAKSMSVPSILTLVDYVGFLNSAYHKKSAYQLADIMITPEGVDRLSSLDFEAYDDLVEMGYQEARRQILRWREIQNT